MVVRPQDTLARSQDRRQLTLTRALSAVGFIPAALALVAWLAWLPGSGGYFSDDWYPVAIGAVALLAVQVFVGRRLLPASGPARAALLLLAAFVAWSFASMLWAISPDGAWQESNQLLLYLVLAWSLSLVPWTARSAAVFAGAWSLGVAVICALVLVRALGAHNLSYYMADGRWQEPVGYANGTSAIAAMSFLPALVLSANRRVPPLLRIAYLVVAAFLVDYALLPQSRGALAGLVVVTPLLLVVAPERLALMARLPVLGAVVAVGVGSIYAVYDAADAGRPVAPVLHHAASQMLLGVGIALVAGTAIVLAEMRVHPSARTVRRIGAVVSVSVAAVLFSGIVVAAAASPRITHYVATGWHIFSSPVERTNLPGPRIAFVNSDQRYDMWRGALSAFRGSPMLGIGVGSFQYYYMVYRHRLGTSYVRQPHDIWLRVLSEIGLVGAVLLLALLLVLIVALLRARLRCAPPGSAVLAVGFAVLAYFLIHSTVDWLDVIPAVAAPAIALPFVALATCRNEPAAVSRAASCPPEGPPRPNVPAVAEFVVGSLLTMCALLSLVFPYLSSREVDSALDSRGHDIQGALAAARAAARLDPLATLPHDVAGTVALQAGRLDLARRQFGQSLDRQDAWYPHLELALLDASVGRFHVAGDQVERARALDPLDPFIAQAADLIAYRRRLDPARFNAGVPDSPIAVLAKIV